MRGGSGALARFLCAAMLAFSANAAGAQSLEAPRRPKLDAKADTNDWEAYYDFGVRQLGPSPRGSYDAFYWAARLAPWSADPLYAQWVAFHLRDIPRFQRYLDEDRKVLTAPDVQRSDSLMGLAFLRNPFVHRGMEMVLFDALPGRWRSDIVTRAWLAYANQKFDKAKELFGRAISEKPAKFSHLRQVRAALFVAEKQYDSALVEMTALVQEARQLDEKELVHFYESKAFYEYAIARLEFARGQTEGAREALERALVEDLAFGPAHVWLAVLSEGSGDAASALALYAQAVDLTPADAIYRYQYAVALLKANRAREALEQIDQAVALEPFYADSYIFKAIAHEQLGQPDSARVAYRAYLDRAARNGQHRDRATRRLAALASGPPTQ